MINRLELLPKINFIININLKLFLIHLRLYIFIILRLLDLLNRFFIIFIIIFTHTHISVFTLEFSF